MTEQYDDWGDWDDRSAPPRRERFRGDVGPRKLTPIARAHIVTAIIHGLHRAEAAVRAGITPTTLTRWLDMGARTSTGPCRDLLDAVVAAETAFEYKLIQTIEKAGEAGEWRASLELLKRRFPDRWGDRQRIDMTVIMAEADKLAEEYPDLEKDEVLAMAMEIMAGKR